MLATRHEPGGLTSTAPKRIWIVDDDPDVLGLLSFFIRDAGFEAECFERGRDVLAALDSDLPDLVILDLLLADVDGLEVNERLRTRTGGRDVPVLVVSGSPAQVDRYRALAAGVNDFLAKPIDSTELLLRIRNHLRLPRTKASAPKLLRVGDLTLDLVGHSLDRGDLRENLTPNELAVLRYLMERPGIPISIETLLVEALGYPPRLGNPEIVRTHVRNLREKIEEEPSQPRVLLNRPRVGYLIVEPEDHR